MTDTELWAQVMRMAREEPRWRKAWIAIRQAGGRDLVKSEDDFERIYGRFAKHPLFAAHMLITLRREDFQKSVLEAMWGLDPSDAVETDLLIELMKDYENGNLLALLKVLDTVAVNHPRLAESLRITARNLYPKVFAQYDARTASAAQLELPLQAAAEQPSDVPAVPKGI